MFLIQKKKKKKNVLAYGLMKARTKIWKKSMQ